MFSSPVGAPPTLRSAPCAGSPPLLFLSSPSPGVTRCKYLHSWCVANSYCVSPVIMMTFIWILWFLLALFFQKRSLSTFGALLAVIGGFVLSLAHYSFFLRSNIAKKWMIVQWHFPPNQPARLPRELKQGFQVQESWCQGRSTQSASGEVAPHHWEKFK